MVVTPLHAEDAASNLAPTASDLPASPMDPISRIEVLAGYLATHNRQIADTFSLLQERGTVDPALVNDGLAMAAMDAEHLEELREAIEETCAALRSKHRSAPRGSDALARAAKARASAAEQLEALRTPDGGWQHEALQAEIDTADVALARHVADDAAGDFDSLVGGDLDFPAKILAQALRGLRNLSARETGA